MVHMVGGLHHHIDFSSEWSETDLKRVALERLKDVF